MLGFSWSQIIIVAVSGGLALPAHAKPDQLIFFVEPKNANWLRHEPASLCKELVKSPRFRIVGEGSQKSLAFTFQGIRYSVPNHSSDPNKLSFQYAADSDGGSESTTIMIDGELVGREFSGVSKIEIKKDVLLLNPGHTAKWDKHKYDCKVSYSFLGKLHSNH